MRTRSNICGLTFILLIHLVSFLPTGTTYALDSMRGNFCISREDSCSVFNSETGQWYTIHIQPHSIVKSPEGSDGNFCLMTNTGLHVWDRESKIWYTQNVNKGKLFKVTESRGNFCAMEFFNEWPYSTDITIYIWNIPHSALLEPMIFYFSTGDS